jgi:hypothetical protein
MGLHGTTAVAEHPLRDSKRMGTGSRPMRRTSADAAVAGVPVPVFSRSLDPAAEDLRRLVALRTGSRIHDLDIDCTGPHVVVTGRCKTWYLKQLVTHAIRSAEPHVRLMNEIVVDE